MTEQAPIDPHKISKIVPVLADVIMKLARIYRRPRKHRENRDKENRKPNGKLDPAIRPTLNRMHLCSHAIMGECFHPQLTIIILLRTPCPERLTAPRAPQPLLNHCK